jgi:hypothetical protein
MGATGTSAFNIPTTIRMAMNSATFSENGVFVIPLIILLFQLNGN